MTEHNPNLVPWLRAAQERGGKGTVELDARSIGRVASPNSTVSLTGC
jgi:hypothetical protein